MAPAQRKQRHGPGAHIQPKGIGYHRIPPGTTWRFGWHGSCRRVAFTSRKPQHVRFACSTCSSRSMPTTRNSSEKKLASSDIDGLRMIAHSLKGAAATLGAEHIRNDAAHLESAATAFLTCTDPQRTLPILQKEGASLVEQIAFHLRSLAETLHPDDGHSGQTPAAPEEKHDAKAEANPGERKPKSPSTAAQTTTAQTTAPSSQPLARWEQELCQEMENLLGTFDTGVAAMLQTHHSFFENLLGESFPTFEAACIPIRLPRGKGADILTAVASAPG